MARKRTARDAGRGSAPAVPLAPFRLGAVPGATPGKWIANWREQRPHQRIDLMAVEAADQLDALRSGRVDAAICRGPLDAEGLHVVALYEEIPVVVMSTESSLSIADDIRAVDLVGEVLITPADDVLGDLGLPTAPPAFDPIATTEDAIATVASGVGIAVVPMSLARLHHRKDVTYRPLADGPLSPVVVAWRRDRDAEDVQALVGIIRGRTARSSR